MPLSFHHTPLIIHAPGLKLKPRTFNCLGGQIDIFPTVMGLMNLPYTNNTMGIDLLKENKLKELEEKVKELNKNAVLIKTKFCNVNNYVLFGLYSEKNIEKSRYHVHLDIDFFSFETTKNINKQRFIDFIKKIPKEIDLLKKGMSMLKDDPKWLDMLNAFNIEETKILQERILNKINSLQPNSIYIKSSC